METVIREPEPVSTAEGSEAAENRQKSVAWPEMIVLLGRRDQPTDGVRDYCDFLAKALARRGCVVRLESVAWLEKGWLISLYRLWRGSRQWKGRRVLAQFTSLMWSRHGFPLGFLAALLILKMRGARPLVVFHDALPYSGNRAVDRIRRATQCWVFRKSYDWATASVLTMPLEEVSWLPQTAVKASFIPVGANIPSAAVLDRPDPIDNSIKTIAVFGITGVGTVGNEVSDIAFVAKAIAARLSGVRLLTVGRGSAESESRFRRALEGTAVSFTALGIRSAEEIRHVLSSSDVSLFVRGSLSTQRGSAIASIACATPLVAYRSQHLAPPFAESGVVTVPCGDCEGLADAAFKVLTNKELWLELRERSRASYDRTFSWESIAARFVKLFDDV